jgi:hypothetical protein
MVGQPKKITATEEIVNSIPENIDYPLLVFR